MVPCRRQRDARCQRVQRSTWTVFCALSPAAMRRLRGARLQVVEDNSVNGRLFLAGLACVSSTWRDRKPAGRVIVSGFEFRGLRSGARSRGMHTVTSPSLASPDHPSTYKRTGLARGPCRGEEIAASKLAQYGVDFVRRPSCSTIVLDARLPGRSMATPLLRSATWKGSSWCGWTPRGARAHRSGVEGGADDDATM